MIWNNDDKITLENPHNEDLGPNLSLFNFDKESLKRTKCNLLIGTDEAGRGPAAGPLVAASVCFREIDDKLIEKLVKLNDSKQISEKTRHSLYPAILECTENAIATVDEAMIDKINILNATCEAMKNACMEVVRKVQTTCIVLVDGNNKIRGYDFPQKTVVKGDGKSASIAAASILAKVTRDDYMLKLDEEFPMYGWKRNKGYLSRQHIEAIRKFGPSKYHRKTYIRNILEKDKTSQQKLHF